MSPTRLVTIFEEKERQEQKIDSTCNLKSKITNLASTSEGLLSRIYEEFHEYTDHSITHKERVLRNFDLILPESLLNNMDVYELFFLIASTYLHDIGMANILGLKKYVVPKNANRFDFIRKYHHLRTKEFIENNYRDLELNEIDAGIIGKICSGHRVEDLTNTNYFSKKLPYRTNHVINIALLSLLLRLADELDLTYERTPKILLDFLDIKSPNSKIEWKRQGKTIGVSLDPEDNVTLLCSAECDDPEIYRSLKKIEDKINNELNYYPDLIGYHGQSHILKEIPRKFRTKITAQGFVPYDFKFSVDRTAIFNLLGSQLYHFEDEPIREALKNAIDTCRYRRELADGDYEPRVKVQHDSKRNQLIIDDNGVGMDQYHIENYLTVIGKSFYSSSDFRNSSHTFKPLSELGIGILSYFVIADKIEIETKAKNSKPLHIIIDNNLDYFLVFSGSRTEEGTKVTLHLKNKPIINRYQMDGNYPFEGNYRLPYRQDLLDEHGKLDYLKVVQYYAVHVEFPIIYQGDTQKIIINDSDPLPVAIKQVEEVGKDLLNIRNQHPQRKVRGYYTSAFRSMKKKYNLKTLPDLSLVSQHVNEDGIKGYVGFVLAKDRSGRLIPWSDLPYIYMPLPSSSLSINGIFIPTFIFDDRFVFFGAFWYDLDLNFPLKLDTSRNEMIDKSERWGLTLTVLSYICDLIEKQILSIGAVNNDQKYNINNDLLYLLEHSKGFTLEVPFVKILFKKYLKYRCISKDTIEYLDLKQVKKDSAIVLVLLPEFLDDAVTQKIVKEFPKFVKKKKYILNPHYEFGNDFISHLRPQGIRNFISSEYYNKLFKKVKLGPSATKKFKEYNI